MKFYKIITVGLLLLATTYTQAQEVIKQLPAPSKQGGEATMKVIAGRHSERNYSGETFSLQQVGDLLWAANGFNRENKRTVPTAQNKQELELYVVFKDSAFFYNAKAHQLELVYAGDMRDMLVQHDQNFVKDAYLNIIVVADGDKGVDRNSSFLNSGYISQNIYLYCESVGLGTVARGLFDKEAIRQPLKLKPSQFATISQAVGVVKK